MPETALVHMMLALNVLNGRYRIGDAKLIQRTLRH
jgi:hypothetical protein